MLRVVGFLNEFVGVRNELALLVPIDEHDATREAAADHGRGEILLQPRGGGTGEKVQPGIFYFDIPGGLCLVAPIFELTVPHGDEDLDESLVLHFEERPK